jgi:hypothetical protein
MAMSAARTTTRKTAGKPNRTTATKSTTKSTTKSAAKSATKSATKSAAKSAAKSTTKSATKSAKSAKSAKVAKETGTRRVAAKPALLTGGNPQIAKAGGDAPVQAYIAAMPGWKREVGRRLDALVARHVPDVRKAVKWNSPLYGIEGQGWFLGLHVFTRCVKATFFRGARLRPVPPGGTGRDARWIDIHEEDLDEAQMAAWIRQAAALPGWGRV